MSSGGWLDRSINMTTHTVGVTTGTRSQRAAARPHTVLLSVGILGIAWNAFGIVQWIAAQDATIASLTADGLSAAQAQAYLALPAWIDVAFAIGVFLGLAGSVALAFARRVALPVLGVSLAAYVALFAGDAYHGLFAVMPAQLAILATVVAIATGLAVLASAASRRGWLR
jgi:hypothetical protein